MVFTFKVWIKKTGVQVSLEVTCIVTGVLIVSESRVIFACSEVLTPPVMNISTRSTPQS